jgi:carboxypeptidase family protein
MGVRSEFNTKRAMYVYTVLNRGQDTLTSIELGFDPELDTCTLTGISPHAVPDTCLSPPGWECGPAQGKEGGNTFCVTWKPQPGSTGGGVLPGGTLSGFGVVLLQPDPTYERCTWAIRRVPSSYRIYADSLKAEGELDLPSTETRTVSGRVNNERGDGVAGALVFVKRADLAALTDSDGTFTIPGVPVGTRSLAVRAVGLEPCDKRRVRVTSNMWVDFRLAAAEPFTPCVPYGTAHERTQRPFPGNAVDTVGARFQDRGVPLPERPARDTSRPRAFIYSLNESEVSLVYPGIGQDTTRRAFVAMVNRSFRNREEERLIRIAEETYPPPEAVLAAAPPRSDKTALSKEMRLWWYGDFDGVRLPYAVTMDAVRYYLQLTQSLGRGDTTQTHGIRMKRSDFSYSASISRRPETYSRDGRVFKDVYVVEMRLHWSNYCGPVCACSFRLDRTVVLRRDGTVLCVFGDQKPMVMVS